MVPVHVCPLGGLAGEHQVAERALVVLLAVDRVQVVHVLAEVEVGVEALAALGAVHPVGQTLLHQVAGRMVLEAHLQRWERYYLGSFSKWSLIILVLQKIKYHEFMIIFSNPI